MTGSIPALATKELRALLPIWALCMVALAMAASVEIRFIPAMGPFVFVLGCLAVGAQSMGHEYAHRTVGMMLAHPVNRRLILLVKSAVLAPLVAGLAALALVLLAPASNEPLGMGLTPRQAVAVTSLAALFMAPFLTMLCRSSIGGLVFTVGVCFAIGPLFTALVADSLGGTRQGAIHPVFFWNGMLAACTLSALGSWLLIARLQAIDAGPDLHLPGWARRADAVRSASKARHPIVWLIAKELRLQQMAFAVTVIGIPAMAVIIARGYSDPRFMHAAVVLAFIGMGTQPLLIGALACAEERQLGTHQWQQLMPIAGSLQWTVKAGVAIGLALLLGPGLGAVVLTLAGESAGRLQDWVAVAGFVIVTTSVSLYVSSLSRTVIRALVMSLGALVAGSIAIPWLAVGLARSPWLPAWAMDPELALSSGAIALSALLLYFAHLNHRSAERPVEQLRWQAGSIAALAVLLTTVRG